MTIAADRWLASPAAGGAMGRVGRSGLASTPRNMWCLRVRTFPPVRPRCARREPADQREEVSLNLPTSPPPVKVFERSEMSRPLEL
jgi:hypothetical protein